MSGALGNPLEALMVLRAEKLERGRARELDISNKPGNVEMHLLVRAASKGSLA